MWTRKKVHNQEITLWGWVRIFAVFGLFGASIILYLYGTFLASDLWIFVGIGGWIVAIALSEIIEYRAQNYVDVFLTTLMALMSGVVIIVASLTKTPPLSWLFLALGALFLFYGFVSAVKEQARMSREIMEELEQRRDYGSD